MTSSGESVVLVVDCSITSWSKIGELASYDVAPNLRSNIVSVIESVCILESAISLFHTDNKITVIAATGTPKIVSSCSLLLNEATVETIPLVKSLTMALCIANRDLKNDSVPQPIRIVVITATAVPAYDFVKCMNCAFAAQKLHIVIDVLDYSQSTTPELMQLVHHTEGWYIPLTPKEGRLGTLSHSMLYYLVVPHNERNSISGPPTVATDMRTVCFCHQKLISIGYVCSVCLSVFCEIEKRCPTCGLTTYFKPNFASRASKVND